MKSRLFCFLIFLLLSCDFTPSVGKDILTAQSYIKSYQYKKAVALYESIIKKNPPIKVKLKILFQIGDLYSIYLYRHDLAVLNYKKILKLTNESQWRLKTEERLGEIYFSFLRNFKESETYYKILSSFEPPLVKVDFYQLRFAISKFKLGKTKEALDYFLILEKKKDYSFREEVLFNIGLINFEKKIYNLAIKYWKLYLNTEKNEEKRVEVTFLLANAYESSENLKMSYNLYYSILGKYPNIDVVRSRLKSIFKRRVARKR